MKKNTLLLQTLTIATIAGSSLAGVTGFESMTEGFAGESFTDGGITFSALNDVAGINPDGSHFVAGEYGRQFIVENATLAINDFPDALSGTNALSFGSTYIAGDNLSINILSSFHMTTGQVESYASMDLLFFENGPWSGITLSLDATLDGTLVASDSYMLSDLGGRDNLVGRSLSIDGVAFDSLQLSARYSDGTYTAFAGLMDNVVITPTPGTLGLLATGSLLGMRRRR
tara:strand:- start:232363 stop:233049 length:687 start_codon:yes stop_codon:yes gene_type:complete